MFRDTQEPRNDSGCELMNQARMYRKTTHRYTNKTPLVIAKEIVDEVRAGTYPCSKRERAELLRNADTLGI